MQSIQQLDDPKNTHNDQCVLQKANVFPSSSSPPPNQRIRGAPRSLGGAPKNASNQKTDATLKNQLFKIYNFVAWPKKIRPLLRF